MIRRPFCAVLRTVPALVQAQLPVRCSELGVAKARSLQPSSPWTTQQTQRHLSSSSRRWSSSPPGANGKGEEALADDEADEVPFEADEQDQDGTPWYMQLEPPMPAPRFEPAPLPALPESSPRLLEPVIKYIHEEMGLDDLAVLDLRDFDPPPAPGPNLIMIFGTARSERHLHVSCGRLVRWVRYHYKVDPFADGLMGAAELKTKLRRMRRRAKLLGTSTITSQGADDGIRTGWICVNMSTATGEKVEEAHHDASGRLSGFGTSSSQAGTSTIVIQAMTESRRKELDLESLWRDALAANKKEREMVEEPSTEEEIAALKAAASPAMSAKARARQERVRKHIAQRSLRSSSKVNKGQTRTYSTCRESVGHTGFAIEAQRPDTFDEIPTNSESPGDLFSHVRRHLAAAHRARRSSSQWYEWYTSMVESIFRPNATKAHVEQQLALVEGLVSCVSRFATNDDAAWRTRTRTVLSNAYLAPLVSAIAGSPSTAESPALQRAQANLEYLLDECQPAPPNDALIMQLMEGYAVQRNWDRFWRMWRQPPLYMRARSAEMYANMFALVAEHGSVLDCIEALRTCVPEMEYEQPPVLPVDDVARALMAVIKVADPGAEEDAAQVMAGNGWRPSMYQGPAENEVKMERARELFDRHQRREFVRLVLLIKDMEQSVADNVMAKELGFRAVHDTDEALD